MKFEQVRKLIDVLVDDYYTLGFGDTKPSIELTLHPGSIYALQEDIHKSFPDAVVYTKSSNLPEGIKYQLNIQDFVINIKEIQKEIPIIETKEEDKTVVPIRKKRDKSKE